MKQRITVNELNKLTDAQKDKLRKWWKPQKWDLAIWGESEFPVSKMENNRIVDAVEENSYVVNEYGHDDSYPLNQCLPLLSIGQMVELLHDFDEIYTDDATTRFNIVFKNPRLMQDSNQDLCDSLWQVCKTVLKESESE